MLLATPENMEKCKDIPGVVALDMETGNEFSADAGDYFMFGPSDIIRGGIERKELILAVKVCNWVDPISGEPIENAQITTGDNSAGISPDKMSMDDALGQGRN